MLEELYAQYGKLMLDAEIINGKLMEVKQKIVSELNKIRQAPAPEAEKK